MKSAPSCDDYASIRQGRFGVAPLKSAALFVLEWSYSQISAAWCRSLAPIKKRVHNGAVKSRGRFNYNLKTLLVTIFNTAPLSNRIRLVQHFLCTGQVRWSDANSIQNAQSNRPYNNNTFIDKENQYDTNVSVIKIKSSLWYQIIFIIKNA